MQTPPWPPTTVRPVHLVALRGPSVILPLPILLFTPNTNSLTSIWISGDYELLVSGREDEDDGAWRGEEEDRGAEVCTKKSSRAARKRKTSAAQQFISTVFTTNKCQELSLSTALPWVLSSAPAKCGLDWMNNYQFKGHIPWIIVRYESDVCQMF